jgi:endonuclease-8
VPEGDTLRRLADKISERFGGQRVVRSRARHPRIATVDFAGTVLTAADAYGKHLFIRFDDGRTLHAHLEMTGSFEVGRPSRESEWRRRVELWFDDGRLTGVAVPVLEVLPTADEPEVTAGLGPDLCAVAGPPDVHAIAARMLAAPGTSVAGAMLDQRVAAGFGNVYANDVPFVAGIDPRHPVGRIDGLADLVAIGTALIRVNAKRGFQNTTGRRMATGEHWVHGRGRGRCQVCGDRLAYLDGDSSGWRRSITWCPVCQRSAPDVVAVDLVRAGRLLALHPAFKEPYFPALRS